MDLSEHAVAGRTLSLVVRVRDSRHGAQARGKQATWFHNTHCHYTRTTGICQTVWLEPVPEVRINRLALTPQLAARRFLVEVPVSANRAGLRVRAVVSDDTGEIDRAEQAADLDLTPTLVLGVPAVRLRPWGPNDPHLYDVRVELIDAAGTSSTPSTATPGCARSPSTAPRCCSTANRCSSGWSWTRATGRTR
jgi:beta-galactosidase/beta-glucuronidase